MEIEYDYSIEKFLLPRYRISPFETCDYSSNLEILAAGCEVNATPDVLARDDDYGSPIFTRQGREALNLALRALSLRSSDTVTIFTTTGSEYISGCVTDTISSHCKWKRKIVDSTKCILVIHEFGKMFPDIRSLTKFDIPIIEDCAYAFPSLFCGEKHAGDHLIFSLSKYLPIQQGGLLISKKDILNDRRVGHYEELAEKVFRHYEGDFLSIFRKRKDIESVYVEEFSKIGMRPYFNYSSNECPGAFVVEIMRSLAELECMKKFLQGREVECSIYYGNNAMFLPCHQKMTAYDVQYIVGLIKHTLGRSS